jgi:hypothetical protein
MADQFMKELDTIAATIPNLEARHVTTANFVRSHVNISIAFLTTAIAAVEQTDVLQAVEKLDPLAAHDTLQFIDAFRPVVDKLFALASALKFTLASRKASLAANALQIYAIAKGVSRDPRSAAVASLVANMKRDLGRRGAEGGRYAPGRAASDGADGGGFVNGDGLGEQPAIAARRGTSSPAPWPRQRYRVPKPSHIRLHRPR